MNRSIIILNAALASCAAILASCNVAEQQTPEIIAESDAPVHAFYAEIESPSTQDTKVYTDESLRVLWHADDRVSIFNKETYNQQYKFSGKTGDNAGGFDMVGTQGFYTADDLDYIYAVYPYSPETGMTEEGVISLSVPAEQAWASGSFGRGANTMISVSSGNRLRFKNLSAYLIVKLYGNNKSVTSVTLRGNAGELISGACNVYMQEGGTPEVEMSGSGAGTTITVVPDSPLRIGSSESDYTAFWFAVPPTIFEEGITVTVSVSDGGVFEKSTSKKITLVRNQISNMAPFDVATMPIPEAVDLGLPSGTKWASFNLGASSPEEYGNYYAWGETEPKEEYSFATYKFGPDDALTKYNYDSARGTVDNLFFLLPEDDAASVHLRGKWHIPSPSNYKELFQNCTVSFTTLNGVIGAKVESTTNGNFIFFPSAGTIQKSRLWNSGIEELFYWTSVLGLGNPPHYSLCVQGLGIGENTRCDGLPIRPVFSDFVNVTGISIPSSIETINGKTMFISACVSPDNATVDYVRWKSSDEEIAIVDYMGNVTGCSEGQTTITATTIDGGYSATCTVTVKPRIIDIEDAAFKQYLIDNLDLDGDGEISTTEAGKIVEINVTNMGDIMSVQGIEYMHELEKLSLAGTKVESLDTSHNPGLKLIQCGSSRVNSLDLSNNTLLEYLYCDHNNITALNLSMLSELKELHCASLNLGQLDVSHNTKLQSLDCYSCMLSEIDLSNNAMLTHLDINSNYLESLDVSSCVEMDSLDCSPMNDDEGNNTLQTLYVSGQHNIIGVTIDRSSERVPDETSIVIKQ